VFTITIHCKDINEFSSISAILSGNKPVQAYATQVVKTEEKIETETAAQPKKSKTKKEKAAVEVAEAEPVQEEKVEAKQANATKEDVAAALQKVNTAKGLAVARQILADFECQRISDVTPEVYADFVHACEQACL